MDVPHRATGYVIVWLPILCHIKIEIFKVTNELIIGSFLIEIILNFHFIGQEASCNTIIRQVLLCRQRIITFLKFSISYHKNCSLERSLSSTYFGTTMNDICCFSLIRETSWEGYITDVLVQELVVQANLQFLVLTKRSIQRKISLRGKLVIKEFFEESQILTDVVLVSPYPFFDSIFVVESFSTSSLFELFLSNTLFSLELFFLHSTSFFGSSINKTNWFICNFLNV